MFEFIVLYPEVILIASQLFLLVFFVAKSLFADLDTIEQEEVRHIQEINSRYTEDRLLLQRLSRQNWQK